MMRLWLTAKRAAKYLDTIIFIQSLVFAVGMEFCPICPYPIAVDSVDGLRLIVLNKREVTGPRTAL